MKVDSYIDRGNSFPIILDDQGKKYFVKLRAGMSGQYALISEWIGNKLGKQLGIQTQMPFWVELDEQVIVDGVYIEVRELVTKSVGLNIGFEYQSEAKDISIAELKSTDKQAASEIYLFDLMMINIDRTPSNLNLMKVGSEIVSVDYESSLLFQDILSNKKLLDDNRILLCLKSNPLYQDISEEAIDKFIEKVEKLSITKIIAEIPASLIDETKRDLLIKGFAAKQKKQWFLKETMRKLKSIEIESKAEKKRRINRNQAEFKRRFKENNNPKR